MEKEISEWFALKKEMNEKDDIPLFKQREIWWASFGINVGDEQNGKGESYGRPVLVVRKYNARLFLGVPLSTKLKPDNPFYHGLAFRGREQSVILMQVRTCSAKRLHRRMGRLSVPQFEGVCLALKELF